MIKVSNYEVTGWEHAIRGMRNPMNSWEKSDSGDVCSCRQKLEEGDNHIPYCLDHFYPRNTEVVIGPNDHDLMMRLRNAGTDHRKFMRMITVYMDICAPLYWWKEFDTYKVGTVANSCSTMHKIHEKEFTLDDLSVDEVLPIHLMILEELNYAREKFIETKDKRFWKRMIQLLPTSYNQKRTVMLNYEVLANMYHSRKNHKLQEWLDLCKWIETLPYSELIIGEMKDET